MFVGSDSIFQISKVVIWYWILKPLRANSILQSLSFFKEKLEDKMEKIAISPIKVGSANQGYINVNNLYSLTV